MRTNLDELLALGRPILADGATGTNYFGMGLGPGEPPEMWNVDHPERVRDLHAAFVAAGADVIVMAAAVADYRAAEPIEGKRSKSGEAWNLKLEPTADVLALLGEGERNGQVLVGFGAETGVRPPRWPTLARPPASPPPAAAARACAARRPASWRPRLPFAPRRARSARGRPRCWVLRRSAAPADA